ncbi:hypothetical protein J4E90_003666 [Alternaria incomplexa]|uniref:uncharacterized protein n=1 Tax=Alternaria incomplexa TaxID=1187928 RepID=UPI00221F351D|nr:uncharacterized protein J4E90_003666 [Alternaria incomplexa]KAI4917159.1 hypothetical protein J4E90_003666 [Alternaria incomplexa]
MSMAWRKDTLRGFECQTPLPKDIINVKAGDKLTAEWHHTLDSKPETDKSDPIDPGHLGPIMVYLARVDDALSTKVTGLKWFKIYEDGMDANGEWAVTRLYNNKGLVDFVLPSCIPSGQYLLRAELIALHAASNYPGAQLYMECAQINVTGDPHPLLAQVPLTLSPFLSLPTSVPLPYSYVTLPSTLPPSILSQQQQQQDPSNPNASASKPAYVTSSTGTSAHPDQILTSCVALQEHLAKLEADARRTLAEWEERRRKEDLAEKRRVAPGWLDSGVHIIKPEGPGDNNASAKEETVQEQNLMDLDPQAERKAQEGEELDRVFGGLQV